jgi:acyl-CoA thioesterase-1
VLRKNLDATVEELRLADVTVVLAGMRMVTNLGPQYTKEFADVYSETAKKHEILFIPFLLEGVAGDPDLNQPDGIHPTAEGHRVMAATLYPSVVEAVDLLTQP